MRSASTKGKNKLYKQADSPFRCRSFNTAQIRILTGPNSEGLPPEALQVMEGVDIGRDEGASEPRPPSRPPSHGRYPQMASYSRRSGSSASALQDSHNVEQQLTRRTARSASPGIPCQSSQNESSGSPSMDSMNLEDDEFEELNILGMHSPLNQDMLSSLHSSSEDEDEEDDEDEDGSDDDDDDEDMTNDSASEEGDGVDPMEIQGHW